MCQSVSYLCTSVFNMEKIKRGETQIMPLQQSEDIRKYREKTDKQDGYYLYQEFWQKRRETEGAWAKNEQPNAYWLEINPDDLTNEDFFYYMLWKSGKASGEEAKKMMKEEYWPRVEKHLNAEAAVAEKRAKGDGKPFNRQKCDEGNSRYNFYQWLLKMVEKPAAVTAGKL